MGKTITAVLLSALVLPGAGHLYLRRFLAGGLLAGVALAALYVLLAGATEVALQVGEQIVQGQAQPDLATLTQQINDLSRNDRAPHLGLATTVLTVTWLIGIVDSYRIARQPPRN
ncbi:MAG: hypothetical protein H6953_09715 [Chromatiaceae bacterium]|nr:hypothetical protein [Chromatiaceae bacterium]MCP5312571.1 hypothetical protein [Chromatiaceae bacterium]